MVDTPYTTINKAFYLEKDLKFYAMLFDTTGGSKISSEEKKKTTERREISKLRREREQAERMWDKGFPNLKLSASA